MKAFLNRAKAFLVNEDGPTATEYAVMLALIIVVSIAILTTLGQNIQARFSEVNDAVS
jgi:pilus assembly protein Flp/PilA